MLKNRLQYLLLSVLSGLMLAFSWPETGDLEVLVFVAFLPLLYLERRLSGSKSKRKSGLVFAYAYLTFLIFNVTVTWWIELASLGGMLLAEIFNSLFMAIVFLLFHLTRKHINDKVGYAALLIYWLAFEYLHINWDLSWIWLTLGNVFANRIEWVQWYEYTGSLGGSFWVLGINLLLFYSLIKYLEKEQNKRIPRTRLATLLVLIAAPLMLSKWIFHNYQEKTDPIEIAVIQPNIDPYNDKFSGMSEREQIDRLIRLSEEIIGPNTELVFGPETALPLSYWEHNLEYEMGTQRIRTLLSEHPNLKYIVGLTSLKLYRKGDDDTKTSRALNNGSGDRYDVFNAVMQVENNQALKIYRKSQLVLGVEKMPFPILEKLAINLGGSSGSLGTEKEALVFHSKTMDGREINVIPAICYESIFGDYLTEFVRKGGNILGVVTNDGWWGNTPGFGQHLAYSRLRAIELRRSVARSANTGISAFINQKGEILQQSQWWTEDALKGTLNLNNEVTFYASHGDYLGRISAFFAVLMFCWMFVSAYRKKGA